MITAWVLGVLESWLSGLSTSIPAVDLSGLPAFWASVETDIWVWLSLLNPVIDVDVLWLLVQISLAVLIGGLAFRVVNYLFNKIPIIAGFGWGG